MAYVELINHLNAKNMAFVGGAVPDSNDFDDHYIWNILNSKYASDNNVAKFAKLECFLSLVSTTEVISAYLTYHINIPDISQAVTI